MKRSPGEQSINGGNDDFVDHEAWEGREESGLSHHGSPASSTGTSRHLQGPEAEGLKVQTGKRSQRDTERRQSHTLPGRDSMVGSRISCLLGEIPRLG